MPDSGCNLHQSAPHCLKPGVKKGCERLIEQTKGGMNTKLHLITANVLSASLSRQVKSAIMLTQLL